MLKITKKDQRIIKLMRELVDIYKNGATKKQNKQIQPYEKLVSVLESVVEGLR